MKNAIKTQQQKLLAHPTIQTLKDYKFRGLSSFQLFLIVSAVIVLLVSLVTQGFSGSTVVQSIGAVIGCLLYTSPSPRDQRGSRMPSSA